jgi:hypothetical protein
MMSWISPRHGYQVELSGQDKLKIFPLDDSQVLANIFAYALTKSVLCVEKKQIKSIPETKRHYKHVSFPTSPEFKAQPLMQK